MSSSRLIKAAGLLVLGGLLAAVVIATLALRSRPAQSHSASPAQVPAGAAAGSLQQVVPGSTTVQGTQSPVQRVITAGPLTPAQVPAQPLIGQSAGGAAPLPDAHGPASTRPIASIAPLWSDGGGGAVSGAPLNLAPGPAPGGHICSAQKNCR